MSEGGKNLRLSLIIEAFDRATGVIEKINARIESMSRPINFIRAKWHELAEAAKLDLLRERIARVGEATEGIQVAGQRLLMFEAYTGIAGGALVELFKHTAEVGEGITRMSARLGISTTQFQRLAYAEKMLGAESGSLAEAQAFLNRNIIEALRGNQQMLSTFHAIGISANDLRKQSPLEILYKIADWMEKFPNKAREGYVAMTLLGRGGLAAIPALREGGKALRDYGDEAERNGIFSKEQLENSEKFTRSLNRMMDSVTKLAQAVVMDLMPGVTVLIDRLTAWIHANDAVARSKLTEFVQRLIDGLPDLFMNFVRIVTVLGTMLGAVDKVVNAFGGWDTLITLMATVRLVQFAAAIIKLIGAIWALDFAILANPLVFIATMIALAIAAIVALGVAIYQIYKHWEGFKAWWRDLWYGAVDVVGKAVDKVLDKLKALNPFRLLFDANGTMFNTPGASGEAPVQVPFKAPLNLSRLSIRNPLGGPLPTVIGAPAKTLTGGAQGAPVEVGGSIDIRIDDSGRPRVRRITQRGPVSLNVGSGPLALGEAR
jgi:hypothetical protein